MQNGGVMIEAISSLETSTMFVQHSCSWRVSDRRVRFKVVEGARAQT